MQGGLDVDVVEVKALNEGAVQEGGGIGREGLSLH